MCLENCFQQIEFRCVFSKTEKPFLGLKGTILLEKSMIKLIPTIYMQGEHSSAS